MSTAAGATSRLRTASSCSSNRGGGSLFELVESLPAWPTTALVETQAGVSGLAPPQTSVASGEAAGPHPGENDPGERDDDHDSPGEPRFERPPTAEGVREECPLQEKAQHHRGDVRSYARREASFVALSVIHDTPPRLPSSRIACRTRARCGDPRHTLPPSIDRP